ncbi:outer membrane beta-barrel family protein [Daejeonella lutea]|uniref:Outer membrane receptor proteins, mostly Fe transport n=1 Tax=Daejeonella lutea TaxID=572036 RepID=A0A1T5EAQ5_9SPHI|nr:outer membrane beta-barrel family protein [Daejeonella lutea]SKB81108.1 Outer membrane receptor proteins, mostly Fe transport [Daejeonella lutea]
MFKSTFCLSLLVLLLFKLQLTAQPVAHQITGQVVDESQRPLPAATVILSDLQGKQFSKVSTDINGRFKVLVDVKGEVNLSISFTGYKTYQTVLSLNSSKDLSLIRLVPGENSLAEVVVQAKQDLIELEGGSIIYNVSKSIDAQGATALDAIKKAPGIYVDNNNTITLNGKQGAMILLDGKQTYMSGQELTDLLRSMPSSGIRSVEIINSPTAKYDAAGSAGIINIKTLKSQIKGFNGNLTTGLAYGVHVRQNQDLSLNYRKNKVNVYGAYNHFLGYYSYLYGSDRIQNAKTYDSFTDDTDKRNRMGSRFGADVTLDKKNTLGVLLTGNFIFGGGLTDTKTDIGNAVSPATVQVLDAVNDYYHQLTQRYNMNLNYKYEDTLGRIINVDADYGYFKKTNGNLQSNIYSGGQNNIISENYYRSLNAIDINLKAFKFDYTTNLGKSKLETGMKFSDISADNDSKFLHVLSAKDSLDDRRSNAFAYDERITSGYVNLKRNYAKWSLQGGLRLENSSSLGQLRFKSAGSHQQDNIRRSYLNLFPSVSASYKASASHNFSLGYSRRIDRPAYQDLNPFVYMLDELNFWQGNPFLQPQLSHRGSLTYAYKSATIVGLTLAHTDQYSTQITDTLDVNKVMLVYRNLGIQNNLSLSLTQNVSPAKWWDISFNSTLYQIRNKISFDQYRDFDLKQAAARMNLQQTFKLPNKFTAEISGAFTSRRLTGANNISRSLSQIDLGLQKSIFNSKGMLRLVLNDIYQGNRGNSVQRYEGFYMRSYSYYESRQLRLNFTYKFADASVKGPRSRNSALGDENGRIK